VFGSCFQLSKENLKRILKALRISIEFVFKSSINTLGLEIADFIAGISSHVYGYNIPSLWLGRCRIFHIQKHILIQHT